MFRGCVCVRKRVLGCAILLDGAVKTLLCFTLVKRPRKVVSERQEWIMYAVSDDLADGESWTR
jgi:hypothetical protein